MKKLALVASILLVSSTGYAGDKQKPQSEELSRMIEGTVSGRYQMTIVKTNVYRITENGKTVCKIAELGEVPCAKFNWPKQ